MERKKNRAVAFVTTQWKRFWAFEKRLVLTKDYRTLFIGSLLVSCAVWLLLSLLSGGRLFKAVFFIDMDDLFMDFFNSIRDASLGEGVYTVRGVIYPPMANLIFFGLSRLLPEIYTGCDWEYRESWDGYRETIGMVTVFTVTCVLLLGILLYKSLAAERSKKLLFAVVGICSVPILNMLERGNIMSLAMIAVIFYAITYDNPHWIVRELGLIALAFSFSIKLYPVILAWFLIGDKRYKEFIRCAIYSLLMLILPCFAFGGVECLLTMVENILHFSSETKNPMQIVSNYTHIPYWLVSGVSYGWFLLCAATFVVAPFVHRERWKIWTIGSIALIAFPALTSTYAWAFFLVPVAMMCNAGLRGKEHLWYFIPLVVPFLFFPIPLGPLTFNTIILYVSLFAVSAYSFVDTIKRLQQIVAEKKLAKQA